MWCCKFIINIVSVSVILVSTTEANTSHYNKRYSSDRNEDQPNIQTEKNIMPFSGERRSASPNEDEVHAGLQLFEMPMVPQFSHLKENYRRWALPMLGELASLLDTPLKSAINGRWRAADHQQEVVKVPLEQLKYLILLTAACSKYHASKTFPSEQESRSGEPAISQSEDPTRRNQKVTAGLNLLGFPLGPQFVYERKDNPNGRESHGIVSPLLSNIGNAAKKIIGGMLFR